MALLEVTWQETDSCGSKVLSAGLERNYYRHYGKKTRVRWEEQSPYHLAVQLEGSRVDAAAIARDHGCFLGLDRCLVRGGGNEGLTRDPWPVSPLREQPDWDG